MQGIYRLMNILATDGNHPNSHANVYLAVIIKAAIDAERNPVQEPVALKDQPAIAEPAQSAVPATMYRGRRKSATKRPTEWAPHELEVARQVETQQFNRRHIPDTAPIDTEFLDELVNALERMAKHGNSQHTEASNVAA